MDIRNSGETGENREPVTEKPDWKVNEHIAVDMSGLCTDQEDNRREEIVDELDEKLQYYGGSLEENKRLLRLYMDLDEVKAHKHLLKEFPEAATEQEKSFGVDRQIAELEEQRLRIVVELMGIRTQGKENERRRNRIKELAEEAAPNFSNFEDGLLRMKKEIESKGIKVGAVMKCLLWNSRINSIACQVRIERIDTWKGSVFGEVIMDENGKSLGMINVSIRSIK